MKALHLVVLLTSVTHAAPNFIRNSNALGTLDRAYSSALVLRHLRSDAAVATTGHTEERATLTEFPPIQDEALKSMLATVSSRLRNDAVLDKAVLDKAVLDKAVLDKAVLDKAVKRQKVNSDSKRETKYAEDAFKLLNLRDVEGDLFDSPTFFRWARYVAKIHVYDAKTTFTSMYSILSRHFNGDDALDKLLLARLNTDDDSQLGGKFASGLLHGQLSRWAEQGKTPEEVFELLKVDETKDELFESPAFLLWLDFFESGHPDARAYDSMYSVLSRHFSGDDALNEHLLARLDIGDDSHLGWKFASGLLHSQLSRWAEQGKTPEEVIELLKVDETKDELFESPAFLLWLDFFESGHPDARAYNSMYPVLLKLLDEDDNLALDRMLLAQVSIKDDSSACRFATNLLLAHWVEQRKTPDEVFKLLELDSAGIGLFELPVFSVWKSFVEINSDGAKIWNYVAVIHKVLSRHFDRATMRRLLTLSDSDEEVLIEQLRAIELLIAK